MPSLSRRQFAAALAASAAAAPFLTTGRAEAATVAAGEVIDRIKKNIGVEWKPDSVDGIKAGDASTGIAGIVTTSMATLAVLQQAVKAGANLVVTAQPTFYARTEAPAQRSPGLDPVLAAKQQFVANNKLVIFRLSDHWRQRRPDPLVQGFASTLGWARYQSASEANQFQVPDSTLDALADTLKRRLALRGGMRIVGNKALAVRRVGFLPGTTPVQASLRLLPSVDAIVAGEVREWESVEYVRDKAFSGEKKGLILLGRVVSEEPGMSACADWLKTFITEVPVRHIPAGDPYWRPAS
jgi:putative NIF3 family GTP cyclohydrolase 1 type 2